VSGPRHTGWAPTHAHVRAVALAAIAIVIAVVAQRSDVAVLAVPFIGAAAWGALHRPTRAPTASVALESTTLYEGQWNAAHITVRPADDVAADGADDGTDGGATGDVVTVVLATSTWLTPDPPSGAVVVGSDGGAFTVSAQARAARWGRHEMGLDRVVLTSHLGAYRTEVPGRMIEVTTLPLSAEFDAVEAVPRPAGLVGLHRAHRQGGGTEPAEVRPFRSGDRMRRINWKVSSRTGALHVTSTWADRDTHVLLLLDTDADLGRSGGIDGQSSSLDISVRAAAAIAQHYLRTGDRVGLIDLGRRVRDIRAGSGIRHLRRLLDALVVAEPSPTHHADLLRIRPVEAGAMVIALTPLVGPNGATHVANLVHHGHTVIVIDTLPPDPAPRRSPWESMATRVRAMERQVDIDQLGELGVAVVPWRGPGTLDQVLRAASRLASAPRTR
jgi:uncharacterized protein (DUF58 family)